MTKATRPAGDPSALHRLPDDVEPLHYDLVLTPDLAAATFRGVVDIELSAATATDRIELHALDLDVTAARMATGGEVGDDVTVSRTDHEDRIAVTLPRRLEPGDVATLHLEFTGVLNDMLCGFYRSTFTDDGGAEHTIATTQFEATDARRAFPCFDEPDRKAVFTVTIDVPAGNRAFSNSPVAIEEKLPEGATRVRFEPTMKMSTYLVAFVVGPLEATEPVDVNGVPVRVVHVPGREPLTAFALEAAAHALRFFTDWFGLPYPGQKLDLVAIPDFAFGAMENLGCVTFRETALLVEQDNASRLELEHVADVIAHEIAHMWFGDLVTMKWWNGIWLNEAFATLMEMLCVDAFRPQWQRWVSFGLERERAMATDALHSTRPVEYPVGPPEEAQGMFDVLTYQKGAAVLRMLERYLGAEVFRDGIRRYLAAHQYANTDTADLWAALGEASGAPVQKIMDSWILQGGFPLVRVQTDGRAVTLRQEPFTYAAAPAGAQSAIGRTWRVPVQARSGTEPGAKVHVALLDEEPIELDPAEDAALVVNAGGAGYYRVEYDGPGLRRLAAVLPGLETLERCNALSDTWAAVVAGRLELGEFLSLSEAVGDEHDPDVWAQVTRPLTFVDHVVDDGTRPLLAGYVRALVGPAFAELGWARRAGDSDRQASLRAQLLATLGGPGADDVVRRRCLELHAAHLAGTATLEPDLAPAVVGVVAAAGGPPEFDSFVDRFHNAATPMEEIRYLHALAGFEDAALADRAFTIAVTEARSQNGPFVLQGLLASRSNGAAAWHRLTAQWDEVVARFPANIVPRMLENTRMLCTDAALAHSVRTFIVEHPLPSGGRLMEQTVERLGVNVELTQRLRADAGAALDAGTARLAAT